MSSVFPTKIETIQSEDEAREAAIDWQNWMSEQSLSYQELADWQHKFRILGLRFGILDEFEENGIV